MSRGSQDYSQEFRRMFAGKWLHIYQGEIHGDGDMMQLGILYYILSEGARVLSATNTIIFGLTLKAERLLCLRIVKYYSSK